MQYVNPYSLLKITPQELEDSPKSLRTAKKRLLAEIELEEEVLIDGIKIERSDALRVIDELDHDDKREFHSIIFYDENLLEFLTNGYTDWFFENKNTKFLEYAPFKDFLIPIYANQFNNVFFEAVRTGDLEEIHELQNSPIILVGNFYDVSRQKVKSYFAEKLRKTEEKLEVLEDEKSIDSLLAEDLVIYDYKNKFYNPFAKPDRISPINNFKNSLFHQQDIKILNALTDDFQNLRDKIARCLQNIAAEINNKLDEHEIALIVFNLADGFKTGLQLEELIKENSKIIQKLVLKQNLSTTDELLNKVFNQAKKKGFIKSKEIKSLIDLVIDIDALNSISSPETNTSIIGIAILLSEIAAIVNDSYFDPDTALFIIDKALKIRIKDPKVSTALLQRLVNDRYRISLTQETINPPKTKQNSPPKTKQNSPPNPKTQTTNSNHSTFGYSTKNSPPKFSLLDEHSFAGVIGTLLNRSKTFAREHKIATTIIIILIILSGTLVRILIGGLPNSSSSSTSNNSNSNTQNIKSMYVPEGMVLVTGGDFMMGSNYSKLEVEKPAHKVSVNSFLMDIYETTNEQYADFVKATNHYPPPHWKNGSYPKGQAKFPVVGVNWEDANAYARWKGKRLPTEEEWEFASRGTGDFFYPWGNYWEKGIANVKGENSGLIDVGKSKGRSVSGIYDMIGNAWEWTASDFKAYPNGTLPTVFVGKTNLKTIRGGSFESTREFSTTTYRIGWASTGAENYNSTGFRCVKDLEKNEKSDSSKK